MPDDRAELVDGGDFVTHGYIMLACKFICATPFLPHSANDRRRPDTRHHPDIDERSRTGLSADALRRGIIDHLRYSIGRPAAALTAGALLPGDRAGRSRPHAGQPGGVDADLARPRPQGHLLPVGRVPDGSAARQQPAEPRHRGRGARGARGARPGPRRGAGVRGGARARQRRPRPAGGLLPRLAGHAGAPGDRLRHPLRVRHLRSGDPRRLAGREDRQLAGQRKPVGDRQARRQLPGQLGRLHRALPRRRRQRPRPVGAGAGHQGRRLRHPDPGLRREHVQRADAVERAGRRVVRAGRVQHRRLLQGGRGRGHLRDRDQGALPERRARGGQAAAPAAAVLLRVVLAAARPAHHGRPGRRVRATTSPSDSRCSSTTPTRRSVSPS